MEKRFVGFLVLAFLVLTLNAVLSTMLWEAPEKPPVVDQEKVAQADPDAEPPVAAPQRTDEAGEPLADEKAAAVPPPETDQAEPPVQVEQQWLAIGSLDPASPYRLLATFTNEGAALRRLELASPRYTELHDRTGYLGHLHAIPAEGESGVRVQVVGPGTPADEAGLKAGDVLVRIGEVEINTPAELDRALAATKPGQTVVLGVVRDGQPLALSAELRWNPLDVMGPERRNLRERDAELPPEFVDPPSYLMTLAQLGETKLAEDAAELAGIEMLTENWEVVEHTQEQVVFRHALPRGLEAIKRFRVAEVPPEARPNVDWPAYHLVMDIEIRNTGTAPQTVAYQLDGPTGLPTEGWWYASKIGRNFFGGVGHRDLVAQYLDQDPVMFSPSSIVEEDVEPFGAAPLMYIGVDAQYFSSVMIPRMKTLDEVWFQEARGIVIGPEPDETEDPRLVNITFRVTSAPHTLAPGGAPLAQSFTLFAGPKRPDLLAEYGQGESDLYNLDGLVYYGWPIWAVVSKVMLGVLHFFYNYVHNYGIAIILLTVLVRGLMFPLSRKQALNMVKMQQLQPEIKKIQEKYKDLEKRTQAQRELFRKNNYNPMGGCLLMFVQLPIFLGLYRALMVDVELRQAPLFGEAIRWCSNLAAPDMLFDWTGFMPGFVVDMFGPYFNVLPLVTVALFIGQQKMFMPPPADEQAALQQKMMQYMMVFIGLMFYKVASGLCLYFIASTLWGMAERKFLPKAQAQLAATPAEPAKAEPRSQANSNGKRRSGRTKRKQK